MTNKIYSQLVTEEERNNFVEELDNLINELQEMEDQEWKVEYWLDENELDKFYNEMRAIKQELKDIEELNNVDLNLWF